MSHIPLSANLLFLELDFDQIISKTTFETFKRYYLHTSVVAYYFVVALNKRRRDRKRLLQKELVRERRQERIAAGKNTELIAFSPQTFPNIEAASLVEPENHRDHLEPADNNDELHSRLMIPVATESTFASAAKNGAPSSSVWPKSSRSSAGVSRRGLSEADYGQEHVIERRGRKVVVLMSTNQARRKL